MCEDSVIDFANELLTFINLDTEDTELFESLKEMWREIREQPMKRFEAIQHAIRKLIDLGDNDIKKCLESGDAQEAAHKLKREITETVSELEQAVRECEEKKIKLEERQSQQQKLKSERNGIKNDINISLPKARYDVNLYSHISNIRWRYDCKPNEVVGYMCDKNNVKPFSFDSNQVSDFFTVNSLWDLMEEDW